MNDKENNSTIKKTFFQKMESMKIAVGLILLLFSFYMMLAMVSYFFTGGADQSLVEHLDLNTTDEIKAQIQNWTGYRGAKLSEYLIGKTFGIPCFIIAYFITRCGLKFMGFLNGKIFRLAIGTIFFTLWCSFLLSFIGAENSVFNFGGHCGKLEVAWVEAQVGVPGAFFLLFFAIVTFLYFFKGMTLLEMKDKVVAFFKSRRKTETVSESMEPSPVKVDDSNISVSSTDETKQNKLSEKESGVVASQISEVSDVKSVVEEPQQIKPKTEDEKLNFDKELEDKTADDGGDDLNIVLNEPSSEPIGEVAFQINAPVTDDNNVQDEGEDDFLTTDGDAENDAYQEIMDRLGPYDPTAELCDFEMPSLDLLADYQTNIVLDEEEQKENKDRIVQVLRNFGIEISSVSATVGPTITLYEIVPAPGVRISKIQSLEKDIALSLAAKGIRIIAPIPGKGTIGIEVPNKKPQIVSMKSVLASAAFQESKAELPVAFGRTITNEVFMVDLAKTPHLLVAGATGMGKSVGLNVLLTSLLYKKHPATMKLVMVDPKQVEFSIYEKIEKHYLAKLPGDASAIITDTTKVVQTLTSLTTEMENRYSLLADVHLRNIKEYNAKFISRKINPAKELLNGLMHHYLPYIVVIIDEYGDLLMTAGKEIETPIARIAQKARAVGIHMVIATQRPSVKIVTGTIKANFPARLAFRVASRIDSQTILDAPGAQELVGKGDMLYSTGGAENTRVQCAFVDTPEVEDVNNFIGNQHGYPEAYRLPEFIDENGDVVGAVAVDTKSLDPRLREAAELVVNAQNGSTSNIQRTLEVGFNRAGRIMDQLEAIGVVGPVCGSKPRNVLVQDLLDLDIIFNNLK